MVPMMYCFFSLIFAKQWPGTKMLRMEKLPQPNPHRLIIPMAIRSNCSLPQPRGPLLPLWPLGAPPRAPVFHHRIKGPRVPNQYLEVIPLLPLWWSHLQRPTFWTSILHVVFLLFCNFLFAYEFLFHCFSLGSILDFL